MELNTLIASRYIFFQTGTPFPVLDTGKTFQPIAATWTDKSFSFVNSTGCIKGFSKFQFLTVLLCKLYFSCEVCHVVNKVNRVALVFDLAIEIHPVLAFRYFANGVRYQLLGHKNLCIVVVLCRIYIQPI